MNHTPGNWKVIHYPDRRGFRGRFIIAGMTEIAETPDDDDENRANADLIALAPEMYEFIKRVRTARDWTGQLNNMKLEACTLINRAEGRAE